MKVPPAYTITNHIITLLTKIEANKTYIQTLSLPDQIVGNLTRQNLLNSSVYSAQIEGNTLSPEDIENKTYEQEKQYERQMIENIIIALSSMRDRGIPASLDVAYLLSLHKLIMHGLIHSSQAGVLRKQPSAIFDTAGNVVYMTPPPSEIDGLLLDLMHIINDESDIFPLIKAPLVHISFEKIHPFLDGNGRVGRLIFQAILAKHGYHFNWLLSVEEILQQKKLTYYSMLDQNDATGFIEFMLETIFSESERLKSRIGTITQVKEEDFLLPRRKEILTIIREQKIISLNQIQRRFLKVPARTLRYDLKQLEKDKFIRKIGTTRGALYQKT